MHLYCPVPPQLPASDRWMRDCTVKCMYCGCAMHLYTHGVTIDADGPEFRAYYCPEHCPDPRSYRNIKAHAQRAADVIGRQVFVVRNPADGFYAYATIAQITNPKDWPTNPEGFPSTGHVISAVTPNRERVSIERPCPCGGAVTCSCSCHDGEYPGAFHEVIMWCDVLVCAVPS